MSELQRAKISRRNILNQLANTVSDDLASESCTLEKRCVLRKMFSKLDVRRKSIVTVALS